MCICSYIFHFFLHFVHRPVSILIDILRHILWCNKSFQVLYWLQNVLHWNIMNIFVCGCITQQYISVTVVCKFVQVSVLKMAVLWQLVNSICNVNQHKLSLFLVSGIYIIKTINYVQCMSEKSNENVDKKRKVGDKKDIAIGWWETEEGQRNVQFM